MIKNIGDVLRLIWRTGFNHAAFSFDIDRFSILRHALRALFKHAGFFDSQMDLFRFDILSLPTHGGRIDIEAEQNICSRVHAKGTSGEFEVIIATVNLDAQSPFQLFDIVIKRSAQAQQASIVSGCQGNFTGIYVQTVPLIQIVPNGAWLTQPEAVSLIENYSRHGIKAQALRWI